MSDTTQIPAEAPKMLDRIDTRSILALIVVVGTFLLFGISAFVKPVDATVLGTATPLATLVLTWFFGSSKSSDDKNAPLIAAATKGP